MQLKRITAVFIGFLIPAAAVLADKIRLQSGVIVEGRILSEDAYEMKVEVSHTSDGSIKNVKIINQKHVVGISRSPFTPPVVEEGQAEKVAVKPDLALQYDESNMKQFERLLQQSDGLLSNGDYDGAIARYKVVASNPKLIQLHTEKTKHAAEALELRINAHKLWAVALSGKADSIEEKQKLFKKEVESGLEMSEDALTDYQRQQKSAKKDDRKKKNRIEMRREGIPGSNPEEDKLKDHIKQAQNKLKSFNQWAQKNSVEIKNYESQIDLLEEKTDQLEDELKQYKRGSRSRR